MRVSAQWGTGQDQMRIVKQRLLEMIPDLSVFLDVDDLEDIGNLGQYIERTQMVLVFCSKGYFQSKNCMIELRSSVTMKKPILPVVDFDLTRGGMTREQVREELIAAEGSYAKWGFGNPGPYGLELYNALFASEAVEWNRLGHFQDVTLRLIGERLLPEMNAGSSEGAAPIFKTLGEAVVSVDDPVAAAATRTFADETGFVHKLRLTYVAGEVVNKDQKDLPPPRDDNRYHVYCSPNNVGALELLEEMCKARGLQLKMCAVDDDETPKARPSSFAKVKRAATVQFKVPEPKQKGEPASLYVTMSIEDLPECDHMLVYLNGKTWTSGDISASFAEEVASAMDARVGTVLAHEMIGIGQEARHGSCRCARTESCTAPL